MMRVRALSSRRWRWALVIAGSLAGACVVLAAVVVVALHSLGAPLIKRRLQAAARDAAGVDVDYRDARIDVSSGLAIDQLVVRSPVALQALAPDLLRVGRVRVRWSLPALLERRPASIQQIEIDDVLLAVVVDEIGRTSFDLLARDTPRPPSVPLSQQAEKLLAKVPQQLARVVLERAAIEVLRTEHGALFDRSSVRGLAAALRLSGSERERHALVELGTPARALALEVARTNAAGAAGSAHAALWANVELSAPQLTAAVDVRMREQSFAAGVVADHWLHAEARARFDAAAARTELTLERADAGDGALRAEGDVEVSDAGDALVRHARGEVDLARLLRWLPEGLVPVRARRAQARFELSGLVAAAPPRLLGDGAAAVDAELSDFELSMPNSPLAVNTAQLALHASPDASGRYSGKGSLKAQRVRFGDTLAAEDVVLDGQGGLAADGGMSGRVDARFGLVSFAAHGGGSRTPGRAPAADHDAARAVQALTSTQGARPLGSHALPAPVRAAPALTAHDGHVELQATALHADGLATRGEVTLSGELGALEASALPGLASDVRASALHVRAHSILTGSAPYAATGQATMERLSALDASGKPLTDAPAHVEIRVRDLRPDREHPAATSGDAQLALALGDIEATLDAQRHDDALEFNAGAQAGSLKAARPFLASELQTAAPWDAMALSFKSRGRIDHPLSDNPALRHSSELRIQHFGFQDIHADALVLTLASHGTRMRHALDLDARARGLEWRNAPASDDSLQLTAAVDRERRTLQAQLTSDGRARTHARAALSFDAATRALRYDVDAQLAGLAPLAPFLSRLRGLGTIDPTQLEVSLSSHGTLSGVIAEVGSDGNVKLAQTPARSALVLGTNDLKLTHMVWSRANMAVSAPDVHWHTELGGSSERRTLNSVLELGTLHVERGSDDVDLNGVSHRAEAVIEGDLLDPAVELTQHLDVSAVAQALVPEYPLGRVTFAMSAEGGRNGVVHISDLTLANGAAGTTLALNGNVDLSEGHRTLSVTSSFTQDLGRVAGIPGRWQGHGKLAVEARITSPDFARYRVRAEVKGDDVSFKLARAGIELERASGEVPVAVSLEVGARGVTFERSDKRNPYSMLRFADQHPLLTRSGFVSIGRLVTPFVSIAPLVGNLEIEQNVISLRQFEMGVRGGTITGQCGLDLNGKNSTLELHVRANGVRSSHGEPFDGNIAVAMSAADRSIDGRAEILRIGERHLLDLLDLQDPMHVDAAMNRIRSALRWGYPKSLRLTFDHGFASAHLELGGLAQFVSIGELRGIPMGPIVDKMLARMIDARELKEMP